MEVKRLILLMFFVGVNSPLPSVDKILEVETSVPRKVKVVDEYDFIVSW